METYEDGYEFAMNIAKDDVSDILDYHDEKSTREALVKELKEYFEIDDAYIQMRKQLREAILKND